MANTSFTTNTTTSFTTTTTSFSHTQSQDKTLPKPPDLELHYLDSRPTRSSFLPPNLTTPLRYTPYIPHRRWINTSPLLLLCRRHDLANRPEKLDYYVTTPDTYPFLTVLSNYMPDRHEFDRSVRPGMVVKFFGACVYKNWYDVREERGSRFKAGRIEGARGHLNIFDKNPTPYYKVCTVYDAGEDGEAAVEAKKLFERWVKDEEERMEGIKRRREEEEERAQVEALERAEGEERVRVEKGSVEKEKKDDVVEEVEGQQEEVKRNEEKKNALKPMGYTSPPWMTGRLLAQKSTEEIERLKEMGLVGLCRSANQEVELKFQIMHGLRKQDRSTG